MPPLVIGPIFSLLKKKEMCAALGTFLFLVFLYSYLRKRAALSLKTYTRLLTNTGKRMSPSDQLVCHCQPTAKQGTFCVENPKSTLEYAVLSQVESTVLEKREARCTYENMEHGTSDIYRAFFAVIYE
jgi:hypothetical protein